MPGLDDLPTFEEQYPHGTSYQREQRLREQLQAMEKERLLSTQEIQYLRAHVTHQASVLGTWRELALKYGSTVRVSHDTQKRIGVEFTIADELVVEGGEKTIDSLLSEARHALLARAVEEGLIK